MVNNDSGTLRAVAWSEVCPWLNLFRCFRLAIRFRLLLLSAIAMLLTLSGWVFFGGLFSRVDPKIDFGQYGANPWLAMTELVPDRPGLPGTLEARTFEKSAPFPAEPLPVLERAAEPFWGTFEQLSRPLRQVFRSDVSWTWLAFLLLSGLWTLAVWAFFGSCITRVAAVQLASEERVGWGPMVRHASSKWRAYFSAPLLPLVGVLVGAAMIGVLGMLLWSNVGLLLAALIWPLLLLGGLLAAMTLLGLVFGWPLMWATISAEGTDSFDALARSYSYVLQRPLHYLFYAIVAVLVGALGWLLVSNFAAAVIYLTYWAADWGAGGAISLAEGQFQLLPGGEAPQNVGRFGAGLIQFWCGGVKLLAAGFLYSYFWTAATAIYFLLRRDADATEMDEVFLEEEEEEQPEGLPPLGTDEAGAPVVADQTQPPSKEADVPASDTDAPANGADTPDEE